MRVHLPTIGTKWELLAPWTFTLYGEYRNMKFWESAFKEPCPESTWEVTKVVEDGEEYEDENEVLPERKLTLPAGTRLSVDRIYIRKGIGEYDSVTFTLPKKNFPLGISGRFWVKLADVNKLDVKVV